jgi:hypothetical protein
MNIFYLLPAVLFAVLPLGLVWTVGIILAALSWKRHPSLSLLLIIIFGVFILHSIVYELIVVNVPSIVVNNQISLTTFFSILNFINSIISVVLWSLLLWAIFGWRRSVATGVPFPPPVFWSPQPFQEQPPQQETPPQSDYMPPQS